MDLRGQQESFLRYLFEESSALGDSNAEYASLALLKQDHQRSVSSRLLDVYPVLLGTLGAPRFSEVCASFVRHYRPASSDPTDCPLAFYEFFKTHDILREIPMLIDLARLELRRSQSAQAPSLPALTLERLMERGQSVDEVTLSLQPHVFVSQFHHPVFTIWQWALTCDGQDEAACARIPIAEYAESVLTFRSGDTIMTRKISRDESIFFKEFRAGKSLRQIEKELQSTLGRPLLEFAIQESLLVADV